MLTDAFQLLKPTRDCREMWVLAEIGRSEMVSQRGLARAAGVSATMINAYIDDLMSRGFIDVTGETNRTYRYFLTETGKARREELFGMLSREVFELYARLKSELRLAAGVEAPQEGPAESEARSA